MPSMQTSIDFPRPPWFGSLYLGSEVRRNCSTIRTQLFSEVSGWGEEYVVEGLTSWILVEQKTARPP